MTDSNPNSGGKSCYSLKPTREYWHNLLKNFTEPTQLAISKKKLNKSSKQIITQLSKLQTQQLNTFINENNLDLKVFIYSVWGVLLSQYSRTDDVVFGIQASDKIFLPIRIKTKQSLTTTKLLKQIKSQLKKTHEFSDINLTQIKQWINWSEKINLFDSTVSFLSRLPTKPNLKHSISLNFMATEPFQYQISYAANYEDWIMRQMAQHLKNLIIKFIQNPEEKIQDISCMSDKEAHKILYEWNDTDADYPKDKTVHQLFEEQVKKTPNNIAVVFEDQKLTYDELNKKANQLAHYLRDTYKKEFGKEFLPDTLIAICVERSLEMIIGILGILKAGGAYVPLDPSYPEKRLKFMLQDTKAKIVLTQQTVLAQLPFFISNNNKSVICLDSDWQHITKYSIRNPKHINKSNDLIYVMYTSGSTGTPKGVLIENKNVVRLVKSTNYIVINENDHVAQASNISFDASTLEIWGALLNGSSLICLTTETVLNIGRFAASLRNNRISILWLTAALFEQYALENVQIFKKLKYFLVGGDVLSLQAINKVLTCVQGKPKHFLNGYGPTENTTFTTTFNINQITKNDFSVPVGKFIANTIGYVLNDNFKPVPQGILGELYIGGEGLARGYLNSSKLTEQKFIKDYFNKDKHARLYKTGDLVRWLPDGNLEFVGRIDNQVKIRGFRVELGEIETALAQNPNISNCVVVVYEKDNQKQLIAYYVKKNTNKISVEELRSMLNERLPDYMLPSIFIELEKLPISLNGKIDKNALPKPSANDFISDEKYIAPDNKMEKTLADIWQNVLNIPNVGVNDNFFYLGGNSLNATQVVSRINKKFNLDCPINVIFENNTIVQLAGFLQKKHGNQKTVKQSIRAIKRKQYFPLSFAQHRLWFLEQYMESKHPVYNIPMAVRLRGDLNINALEKSLNFLIARYESLRTVFKNIDGKPQQEIQSKHTLELALEKITEKQLSKKISDEAHKPFALDIDPLIRVRLFEIEKHHYVLVINQHHIISDGWSMGLFIKELNYLYDAYIKKEIPKLSELKIQYVDFADWQRKWLESEEAQSQIAYWKNKLKNFPVLNLPTDFPRPGIQTYNGKRYRFSLNHELTNKLKDLGHKTDTTLFMVLLAVFNILLARLSNQEDIIIGSPIANRNRSEIENIIGFFVNTLVLRNKLSGNPIFIDFLAQVKQTCLEAYNCQGIPFERLVDELKVERDISRHPIFQVMFILQNATEEMNLAFSNIRSEKIPINYKVSKFDLTFELTESELGLNCIIEYNTDLYRIDTIQRMVGHFTELVKGIVKNPKQSVQALPLLTEAERKRILIGWNQTKKPYPKNKTIHELFEDQVRKTPNNIAVVFEDHKLTYDELNQKANQLAHYLRDIYRNRFGEEFLPDSLIAIYIKRNLEMVIGLLGVLKAGGAYIPIDPVYPKNRISYMLENGGVHVVLTQKILKKSIENCLSNNISDIEVIVLDDELKPSPLENDNNFSVLPNANSLAYVMYTSGSTGKPKGVMIEHRPLINFLFAMQRKLLLTQKDVFLALTSFSFDISGLEIYLPLLQGACCVITDIQTDKDITKLSNVISSNNVTTMQATPSIWRSLINSGWENAEGIKIVCGGEALDKILAGKLSSLSNFAFNMYGPTETTIWSTMYHLSFNHNNLSIASIGKPIANTTTYILNEYLQPLPVNTPGELHIGGDGLARGYLNQPELTKEKFIKNPFSKNKHSRLYKTGDLVRWLPDGNLEFLGRIDDQVKVRGFRIELDEVNTHLAKFINITQSVVLAKKDDTGNNYLVGYVVPVKEKDFDLQDVRNHLQQFLPEYMIPEQFVVLNKLPITPNGKVDKKTLLEMKGSTAVEATVPDSDLEISIAEILQELLQFAITDANRNFFEMGVHSFMIVQACSLLGAKLNAQLKPIDLFTYPTIKSLAGFIAQAQGGEEALFTEVLTKVNRKKYLVKKRKGDVWTR